MAKSKVINTVLNLRDNMSGGLLKAARNAKKAGAKIDDSMIQSTRRVIAFKNKSIKAMQDFAKKSVVAAGAAVTGLTTAFIALDGATEDFRVSQGKLLTAFAGTATGTQGARTAYAELYKVIGDSDTATEAAQALSTLAQSQQDITKWTRVAAGVVGKFGDGISINSLFQDISESAVRGSVTNTLADTLNWLNISEDEFNERLEATGTTAGRTTLILDTLTAAYNGYADAFYQNNTQLVKNRAYQTQVNNTLAKLGEASATAKNGVMQLLGAQEDGSYRAGSALEWLNQKADAFSSWVSGLDMETLTTQFDQKFAGAVNKAKDALQWCKDNADKLKGALKSLATAFVTVKVVKFTGDLISSISTVWEFIKTVRELIAVKSLETYCWVRSTAVVTANKMALLANKAAGAVRWLTDQTVTLMANAVQWTVDTAAIAANKAALLGHKIVGGATWLLAQAAALGAASAAWMHNTAVVTANKMALLANKAAGAVRWLTDQTVTLMANAVQWTVDTAAIAANKAALLGHKIVGGATWLLAQAAALGAASAAWMHNTAMMAVNKAGQLASAAATGIATGATTALTAAQWALNAAFVATPIGWIVLGLGAVVTAGVALYKNWDTIKQYAGQLWAKVKETFGGIKDSIVGAFNSAKNTVSGFFSWLDQKIESIPLLGSLYSGGKSALSWIGGKLTGNALGTSYWRGGLTRVNERGGEIMNLPSGTQIIPHDISARMAGGPRVTVNVTVAGNVIGNEQYADELGERITDKLLRAIENM